MSNIDDKIELDDIIRKEPVRKLQKGDILFCKHTTREYGNIHCAMYIGDKQFIESMPVFGVRISKPRDIAPFWNLFFYGYVKNANEDIIESAIDWACRQQGCRYQYIQYNHSVANYKPNDRTDPFSHRWYCSELIWAAYMNASNYSINLGKPRKIKGSKYTKVWVIDLQKDIDQIQIFCPRDPLLPL